jgi:hypothetical protein
MLFLRNRIILHHSGSAKNTTPDQVRAWHVARNFPGGFGYHHYFYWKDGVLTHYLGRPECIDGVHCKGRNSDSIGFCIAGNYDHDTLSEEDRDFITEVLAASCYRQSIKPEMIEPHNKWRPTACPGQNLINDLQRIQQETAAKIPSVKY